MTKIYDEKDIVDLKKIRNKYLIIVIVFFLLANVASVLLFVFTNRDNLILMEVLFAIMLFGFLSASAFFGLTLLRKTVLRIKLIHSFSAVISKRNEVSGEIEVLQEKRKYYGFTFIKIKVNDCYYFVEEGIELPKTATLFIKKGFVVAYE